MWTCKNTREPPARPGARSGREAGAGRRSRAGRRECGHVIRVPVRDVLGEESTTLVRSNS